MHIISKCCAGDCAGGILQRGDTQGIGVIPHSPVEAAIRDTSLLMVSLTSISEASVPLKMSLPLTPTGCP